MDKATILLQFNYCAKSSDDLGVVAPFQSSELLAL